MATRPLDAIRRFWWVVLLFTILGAVVGGYPSPGKATDSVTTTWNASHTLLVSNTSSDGTSYTDPQQFSQLQLFVTTGEVPARAAEAIGYSGAPAALAAEVTVTADQQSGALQITTTQPTADEAVAVADAFGDALTTYLSERQDQLLQDRLDSSLARLQALEDQIAEVEPTVAIPADPLDPQSLPTEDPIARAQLDALGRQYSAAFEQYNQLQADQGQLVLTTLERAQPVAIVQQGLSAPRSRTTRAILGGLVGFAIGVGVALLLGRADRKLRTAEQAAEVLGLEPSTVIPAVRRHHPELLAVTSGQHGPLSDSYRTLRSMIAFLDSTNEKLADRASVTLVVSSSPGDGKTSVSANLAAASVEAGNRTVAVNTDFRRPTLSKRLGVFDPEPAGLTLAEIESAPLELVLAPVGDDGLAVLDLAGMRGYTPGDLARVTARLLPRIDDLADSIIIDTSPVGVTAEVLEFVPDADNIVMVVRLGHTAADTARRSIETIRTLSRGNLLLVLVGGDTGSADKYYYYYSKSPQNEAARTFGRRKPKEIPVGP